MSELKPCPFCGGEATERDFTDPFTNGWVGCQKCHCFINWVKSGKPLAIEAWNRRATQPNEPLSLDELEQMNYGWVWVERIGKFGGLPASVLKYVNGYGYVLTKHQKIKLVEIDLLFDNYGAEWLAYKHKLEVAE